MFLLKHKKVLMFFVFFCPPPAGKTGLEKEQEFIRKCMESLLMASANLEKDAHSSLTSIERGLLMLKTHLEAFRRRCASVIVPPKNTDLLLHVCTVTRHTASRRCRTFYPSGSPITCVSGRSRGRASAAT